MTFNFDDTYDFAVVCLQILNRRLHHQFMYAVMKNIMTHATMIYKECFLNRKIDDIFHHNFTQLWQFTMIWDKCILLKVPWIETNRQFSPYRLNICDEIYDIGVGVSIRWFDNLKLFDSVFYMIVVSFIFYVLYMYHFKNQYCKPNHSRNLMH